MVQSPNQLIADFCADASSCGLELSPSAIGHEFWPAPHIAKDLRPQCGAVYVFSLPHDSVAPAGADRALKVGKAGPSSNTRFRYQHYKSGSAQSTLSGALESNPILFSFLGIFTLPANTGDWIRAHTDRDNFFVSGAHPTVISLLEVYLKARLGPVFEGSLSSKV